MEKQPAVYGTFHNKDLEDPRDSKEDRCSRVPFSINASFSEYGELAHLLFLFGLWYLLNVLYNIDNKHALIMLPLPWTVSTFQLLFGWIFFLLSWGLGLRKIPKIHSTEIFMEKIVPQGVCHFLVHIGAVISMRCGAVSFTHIVKAGEPVITCILSYLFMKQQLSWQTYLCLVPIIAGVIMASVTELSFTWLSFYCAMISSLGSSSRAIFAKKVMVDKQSVGENLTSQNMYALLTIVATMISIPLAIFFEGSIVKDIWNESTSAESPYSSSMILSKMCLSALWYYSYNEIAFLCLEKVNQITHAVANTLKRVVIIVASIIVFQTPVTTLGAFGSTIAITGTFLYSLSKSKFG